MAQREYDCAEIMCNDQTSKENKRESGASKDVNHKGYIRSDEQDKRAD